MNGQNTFTINTKVDPETLVRNLPIIYNVINFKNYYLIDKYLIIFFGKNYDYFWILLEIIGQQYTFYGILKNYLQKKLFKTC